MAGLIGRNEGQTPGTVNRRDEQSELVRRGQREADIRFARYVRPDGPGRAIFTNATGTKEYRVTSPVTYAPGTLLPLGSNSGAPGEFVVALPPAQAGGASSFPVSTVIRSISSCPAFVAGKNYGSFSQNDTGTGDEVNMGRVIGSTLTSDEFSQLSSTSFGDGGVFSVIQPSPLILACMSNANAIGVNSYRVVAWNTSTGSFVLNSEMSAATTAVGCIVGDLVNFKAWWWEHDAPSTWRVYSIDTSNTVTLEFTIPGVTPPGTPAYYGPQGYIAGSMLCGNFLLAVVRGTQPGIIKFDLINQTGAYVSAPALFPAAESLWAGEDGWQQGSGIVGSATCVIAGPATGGGNIIAVEIDANGATVKTLVPASWGVASGTANRVSPGVVSAQYGVATPTQTFRRIIAAGVDPLPASCTIGWETPGLGGIWPLCID